MKIGSHVNNSGNLMLLGSVTDAINNGANCLMIYLGAPQNTFRKPIESMRVEEAIKLAKAHNINPEDIIVHAPYIVNLAQNDPDKFLFACNFLTQEVIGTSFIGAKYIVIHPGSHVGMGSEYGIPRIAVGLNRIIKNTENTDTILLIETMAGKGSECGRTFEEISKIIELIDDKKRIGVCLDTCHISDAGYNITDEYEEVIQNFDQIIGLSYLKVIHLNDTKNPRGSHKDRHANIGYGYLGFDTIMKFINDERFSKIPKILETPYVEETNSGYSYSPYKEEIKMIRAGKFNENLLEDILNSAKPVIEKY